MVASHPFSKARNAAMNFDEPSDRLLSIKEVADLCGVSWWTVRRLINRGDLPLINIGTDDSPINRVPLDDVRAYIARRRVG